MAEENKEVAEGEEDNKGGSEDITPKEEIKVEISPEEKIKELEDKLLRTVAEMDNMRKRSDKERSEAYKIGASIFIKDMLPIIDNLQRALSSFVDDEGTDTQSFVDGTNAILRDFVSLLDKTGVKTINPEGLASSNFKEPLWNLTAEFTKLRPSPEPFKLLLESNLTNLFNTFFLSLSLIPSPLSLTHNEMLSSLFFAPNVIKGLGELEP